MGSLHEMKYLASPDLDSYHLAKNMDMEMTQQDRQHILSLFKIGGLQNGLLTVPPSSYTSLSCLQGAWEKD